MFDMCLMAPWGLRWSQQPRPARRAAVASCCFPADLYVCTHPPDGDVQDAEQQPLAPQLAPRRGVTPALTGDRLMNAAGADAAAWSSDEQLPGALLQGGAAAAAAPVAEQQVPLLCRPSLYAPKFYPHKVACCHAKAMG